MTTWYPDTDDCAIEISDAPETRGQIVGFVRGSGVHATAADVLVENQTKNRAAGDVEAYITANRPAATYTWRFDAGRVIEIVTSGLTSPQRNSISSTIATKYAGKVRVV